MQPQRDLVERRKSIAATCDSVSPLTQRPSRLCALCIGAINLRISFNSGTLPGLNVCKNQQQSATMGAKSSSPRTVHMENDSPNNVIDVSEAVVDRLKGLHTEGLCRI